MRVLVVTAQVPFVRGGAEIHAEGLREALVRAGHEAEIVAIPFKWYPPERIPEQILASRLMDLSESCGSRVDRVVGLKFPAYLVPHPAKVLWILHQHRTAYDLWGSPLCDLCQFPNGRQVRDAIRAADNRFIREARAVYANSANVAGRLKRFNGIDAQPLYHPPRGAESFRSGPAGDWLYFPSRINRTKRQDLVVAALAQCREPVAVRFSGMVDDPAYKAELEAAVARHGLAERVSWLGEVSEADKLDLYAGCLGVVFPPVDEDYGYITLEAMLSAKPVITTTDSGGPLEFVRHGETGLVAEPKAGPLAAALDRLWRERRQARDWGEAGRAEYDQRRIGWSQVVETLLA